jgi:hypothetical protein
VAIAGCASQPPPGAPEPADHCRLPAEPAKASATLTVALPDPVDLSHVSNPTNDSERLLFRHVSGTLVRVDCQGEVRPGLAARWSSDSTGRAWTFILAEPGRLTARPPITAGSVASAWRAREPEVRALGIDSAVALDERTLRITLGAARDTAPRLFADPLLSVGQAGAAAPDHIVVPSDPPVDFQLDSAGDPRDALDRGVDLIVTRDPAVAEYVSARPEFETFVLPWSRTYVLLQPAGTEPITRVFGVDSVARSLARDVVRAEARPAEAPFWWDESQACLSDASFVVPQVKAPRILYPRIDEIAKGVSERIVALAADTRLRAVGVSDAEFASALAKEGDLGYIVALPRQVPAPCYRSRSLPHGASIQALIDTRAQAIVRRGVAPLSVDWDGTVEVGSR